MKTTYIKGQIPTELFEEWKTEIKKSISDGGGLIHYQAIFETLESEGSSKEDKRLAESSLLLSFESDLARKKELLCPDCNGIMQVYYTPICFCCKKPKNNNYIESIYWLENNEETFDGEDLWHHLIESGALPRNDSEFKFHKEVRYNENFEIFKKHFDTSPKTAWTLSY